MALEDFESIMTRCVRCSLCKFPPLEQVKSERFANVCPSIAKHNFHTYSGGGKLITGLALLHDRLEYTDEMTEIIYRCQMCGACDVSCKYNRDMEILEPHYELRARLVNDGQLLPAHMMIIEGLRKEDNMLQRLKSDRGNWAEGLDLKDITKETAEVVYHAGCRLSFDEGLQKVTRGAVSLLRQAGIDVGIAGTEETCCGGRAYELGYQGELIKYAEHNIDTWRAAGAKTVVTSCADCYCAFKVLYDKIGLKHNVQVLHITEYLDRLIQEGRLRLTREIPMTVTYHDPCHLGRKAEPTIRWQGMERKAYGQLILHDPIEILSRGTYGVYEAPRNVLKRIPGLRLVEMERTKEYAWCCGAGGGIKDAYPDFAIWTALERIEEAKAAGASMLVTACPWCERNFNDALSENGGNIKVCDIVELVQQACDGA